MNKIYWIPSELGGLPVVLVTQFQKYFHWKSISSTFWPWAKHAHKDILSVSASDVIPTWIKGGNKLALWARWGHGAWDGSGYIRVQVTIWWYGHQISLPSFSDCRGGRGGKGVSVWGWPFCSIERASGSSQESWIALFCLAWGQRLEKHLENAPVMSAYELTHICHAIGSYNYRFAFLEYTSHRSTSFPTSVPCESKRTIRFILLNNE